MLSDAHLNQLMKMDPPTRFVIDPQSGARIDSEENRVGKRLKSIANLVKEISEGNDELFRIEQLGCKKIIKPRGLGLALTGVIERSLDEVNEYFPCNSFHPYSELLMQSVKKFPVLEHMKPRLRFVPYHMASTVRDALAEVVQEIRDGVKTKAFREGLDHSRRRVQKNAASARKRFNSALSRHSKVLAIRLDLVSGQEIADVRGITNSVGVKQARAEFAKFQRYIRDTYPILAFFGCLEYGALTGIHFHVAILLNGHLKQRDIWLAKQMGEHWKNVITERRGRYFNSNALRFPERAVGMIRREDYAKRRAFVKHVIAYLTKPDFWVRFTGVKKAFVGSLAEPRIAK